VAYLREQKTVIVCVCVCVCVSASPLTCHSAPDGWVFGSKMSSLIICSHFVTAPCFCCLLQSPTQLCHLVCPLSALSLSLIFLLEAGSFTIHSVLLFLDSSTTSVVCYSSLRLSRSPLSSVESSALHTSLFNFPFSTVSQTIELCSVGAETFTLFSFNHSAFSSPPPYPPLFFFALLFTVPW